MGNDTQVKEDVLFSAALENKDTASFISNQNAIIVAHSAALNPADTLALTSPEEKEKQTQKANGAWRVSVVFAPQFVTNTLKPLTDDEVFVTEINQITQVKPSGYGLAIGIGKAVTPQLYIDGQISYSTIQQNIQYDYSDGTVDTLLTVEQPDKSYLVSPVYAIETREVSANYNYGGVRLGATYYFWSTPRTRFNMTASFGAHYMLSSKVKEKINDEWITINNESVNKVNYSFSAGAGYNIMMGKGWELMINPMLTWYLKEIKSQEVPYSVREEALGLNFMLSKTIGSK
jgi:opacity protein-like surface antigen